MQGYSLHTVTITIPSKPPMKYTVWANGISMPNFYPSKHKKHRTDEPPALPPKLQAATACAPYSTKRLVTNFQ
eukprot:3699-Heterococcus_DN1.PRE.4